ncbi:MAG: DUF1349 domain-containing protein, partial [Alphaproteobacteria bacterium]|nr:DUF1349 domain-containing protein [Alphaproteobacteria bacterium]
KGMLDLGDIILAQDATVLNEALVVAGETPKSLSVEKTRINTASSAAAATGSVLEVIREVSAISVDGSGGISIRGNSNVLILVDGIPTTLGGLESIPAANVQSIEIVTSPDVKYDSEGTGGIVNIISKKQSANMFSAMAAFNYGFNGFMNGNVALNYNKGRWGVRFNYNGKYEKDRIESELHRQIVTTGGRVDQLIHATKRTSGQNECGLMGRVDEYNWCKISLIRNPDHSWSVATSVTCNGTSDLSLVPLPVISDQMSYRLESYQDEFCLSYSLNGKDFVRIRLFQLPIYAGEITAGAYICNPSIDDFSAPLLEIIR